MRVLGDVEERRSEGTTKVRMLLSALEVRMLVPSGVLKVVSRILELGGEAYH